MPATRWGIASAGKISHDFVAALRSLPAEEHTVIAVAARELSRAQDFAKLHEIERAYDDYAKLAQDDDIEIVYVGVIHPQHYDVAMLMLNHGKHVLCEKPLTMNFKQTAELICHARDKQLFLMEGVWSRFFPLYDTMKKEIASGRIGDVRQVIVSFGHRMPEVERITKKELGGGTILDLGVYGLQFACLIYDNDTPESIKTAGFLNENGVDMSVTATLCYKDNRSAVIMTHALVDLPNEAYVCGTKGMLRLPNFWCPTSMDFPTGTTYAPLPELKHKTNFINSAGLCYEAAEARECILKGLIESPKMTHDTSLLLVQLEDQLRTQMHVVYPEDPEYPEDL